MQYLLSVGEIEARANALNLSLKRLSTLACVHHSTAYRCRDPKVDPRVSTKEKLVGTLVAEEKRLLAHLIALHGVPSETERGAA